MLPPNERRPAALALLLAAIHGSCIWGARRPEAVEISVPYELETLDPHAVNALSNFAIASHFYEPLVTTDADMKIRPCLARLWETPDLVTWVFHLQPGISFHSGRPLRAEDVVYSVKRLLGDPKLEIAGYVLYISDVSALGPLTVRIRTRQPLSILLNKLRFVAIVPQGATAESLAGRPDGTGPYALEEWKKGESLRLVHNERHWGGRPAMARVRFRLARSPDEAAEDFSAGRSQLVQCNSRRLEAELRGSGRAEILRRPSLFVKYIGFDLARETTPYAGVRPNPFRNKLVRQAFHFGIDRQRLVDALSTDAVPTSQLVPPFIFGFNPSIRLPAYDPARAKALLGQAGLASGFGATLHVRRIFSEAGFLVRDQLRLLGIRLDVTVLPDPQIFELFDRQETTVHLSRFGCPTGDASDILDNALHSKDPARHMGIHNFAGYANPEVDRAIEQSAGIDSVAERRKALERIMALLMEDLVWVPLYIDQDVYALDRAYSWQPRSDSFILAAEIGTRR